MICDRHQLKTQHASHTTIDGPSNLHADSIENSKGQYDIGHNAYVFCVLYYHSESIDPSDQVEK
jgi:hypothetical protein